MSNQDLVIIEERDHMLSCFFNSLLDFMDYEGPENHSDNKRKFKQYKETYRGRESWLGPDNKCSKDVIDKALIGNQKLYDSLQEKIMLLNRRCGQFSTDENLEIVKKPKRRKVWKDQGDELDIHKVYAGQLSEAWRTTVREAVSVKHSLITLFIDISGIATVDVFQSLWRSAVAVKMLDDLLKAGKSVRVIVGGASNGVYIGRNAPYTGCQAVTVKQYNESLSVDRLAAMSHLGFFRTFGFAAKHCSEKYSTSWGLGSSINMRQDTLPWNVQDDVKAGHTKVIIVPKSLNLDQAVQAIRALKQELAK